MNRKTNVEQADRDPPPGTAGCSDNSTERMDRMSEETRIGYEDGELFARGPCGRYAVRAFGPTDDPEEADESDELIVSFSAAETEPEQQTLDGFAVYKRTEDGGLRWVADSLTLGHALDIAQGMAETGRAPSPLFVPRHATGRGE